MDFFKDTLAVIYGLGNWGADGKLYKEDLIRMFGEPENKDYHGVYELLDASLPHPNRYNYYYSSFRYMVYENSKILMAFPKCDDCDINFCILDRRLYKEFADTLRKVYENTKNSPKFLIKKNAFILHDLSIEEEERIYWEKFPHIQ